jgi:hypothetical protein
MGDSGGEAWLNPRDPEPDSTKKAGSGFSKKSGSGFSKMSGSGFSKMSGSGLNKKRLDPDSVKSLTGCRHCQNFKKE